MYFLPKGYIEIIGQLNTNANPANPSSYHYTFQVNPIIQPDYDQAYLLRPDFSAWSHDTFQLTVSNGLLASVNSSNSDQTSAVVIKLAQTAGAIMRITALNATSNTNENATFVLTNRPLQIDLILDVADDTSDSPNSFASVSSALSTNGITIQIPQIKKSNGWKGGWQNANGSNQEKTNEILDGIYYRSKLPYVVTITDTKLKNETTSKVLVVPSPNPILSLVPRRSALITRTTTLSFQDGCLTSVGFDKPSTALAWVSLPLDAVKAFLSAPTEILQLKLNYVNTNQAVTSAESSIVSNELTELKNRVALLEFQKTNGVIKP